MPASRAGSVTPHKQSNVFVSENRERREKESRKDKKEARKGKPEAESEERC
jgi:hypothetical protein